MKLPGAVIGGVVAAVIGGAAWTLLSHYAGIEFGILAWAIGGLVGFAVMLGAGGSGTPLTGVIAVVLAALSILGGKWAAVELDYGGAMAPSDEMLTSYLADDVVAEKLDAGERLAMPAVPDGEVADEEADYPADVWAEAVARWEATPAGEREALRDDHVASVQEFAGSKTDVFASTFGLFDVVFFGLAVFTAYKLGSASDEGEGDATPAARA